MLFYKKLARIILSINQNSVTVVNGDSGRYRGPG